MAQANLEVIGLMKRKEEQEVLANITTTPRGIPIREHTTTHVHPLSGRKRVLGWMNCEEKWTKSNLLHLTVSTRRMKMQRHGYWEWESIFNCIIIVFMQKVEFPSINSRERHPCGGIIFCRYSTLKRRVLPGNNSRSILRRNTWLRDTITRKWKSYLNSRLGVWPYINMKESS